MPKYEYTSFTSRGGWMHSGLKPGLVKLQEMEDQGWELVTILKVGFLIIQNAGYEFVLRKPVRSASKSGNEA